MPTNLYHIDPYRTEVSTRISAVFEEDGRWHLALEDNLFYPQGGGQKGDIGTIETGAGTLAVTDTIKDRNSSDMRPLLILKAPVPELAAGMPVKARIDWNFRLRQMRLHSAVHLHHCMMERVSGNPIQYPKTSDIGDGEAYNRYEGISFDEAMINNATAKFHSAVTAKAPVVTRDDEARAGYRWWDCLGFSVPCGGTHLHDISEIGNTEITFSQKKGKPKITIRLL
jgi:Ser-tRNA(Ala) deacylase AlaX